MGDIYTDFKSVNLNTIYNSTMEQLNTISKTILNNVGLVDRAIRQGMGGRVIDNYKKEAEKQKTALSVRSDQQNKIDDAIQLMKEKVYDS